jgi:hypothetical protein
MAAASIVFIVHGMDYVNRAIAASPALQWPMKYFFLAVPVGGALNLFFLVWPESRAALLQAAGRVLAAGLLLYLAVRYGAAGLYGQGSAPSCWSPWA